jgi:hypothetical protein
MSQNNLTIADGTGYSVRTGFNNAIQSVASLFSGATDPYTLSPSCAFAGMLWMDTGNSLIKQRDSTNASWIAKGTFDANGTIKWYDNGFSFSGDFNSEISPGIYYTSGTGQTNAPAATNKYHLWVSQISSTVISQKAIDAVNGTMFARVNNSGSWTAWTQILTLPASSAQGDIYYYSGTDFSRLAAGTLGQLLTTNGTGSNPSWTSVPTNFVPVRQTVLSGDVDATGQANQLQIGTGLAVNELATTVPTVTTWANGFESYGGVDYIQRLTADVTSAWSGLTGSSTLYLYKERNSGTGAVTYGFTTLAPIYQNFAPGSPSTNQYWFDTSAMVGQYYSGSAWISVQRVFVGECVTGVSTVTTVTSYQFKGKYISDIFSTAINTLYTKSSNLGIVVEDISILYRVNAADLTVYRVYPMTFTAGSNYGDGAISTNSRNTIKVQTGTQLLTYNSAFFTAVDSMNDKTAGYYQIIAKRGW